MIGRPFSDTNHMIGLAIASVVWALHIMQRHEQDDAGKPFYHWLFMLAFVSVGCGFFVYLWWTLAIDILDYLRCRCS